MSDEAAWPRWFAGNEHGMGIVYKITSGYTGESIQWAEAEMAFVRKPLTPEGVRAVVNDRYYIEYPSAEASFRQVGMPMPEDSPRQPLAVEKLPHATESMRPEVHDGSAPFAKVGLPGVEAAIATVGDGGSAFPVPHLVTVHGEVANLGATGGMTLRDYFAAAALQGLIASGCKLNGKTYLSALDYSPLAFQFADAMLKTRTLPNP